MPARLKAPGCPTESAVRRAHAVGREDPEHPRDRRAPVVADDVHPFDAEMIEHADEVREQERDRIVLDPFRLVGRAEAAHVGRDRPVPGGAQRGDLVIPERMRVGPAVDEQHGFAVAGAGALVVDFDPRAVDVDAHDGSVYSVNSDMTRSANSPTCASPSPGQLHTR